MVVLVTGSSGQLGQALQLAAQKYPQLEFHFANSAQADVTDVDNLRQIFQKIKPGYCINAAAYTAVDKAESEPGKAHAINVDGAQNIAQVCKEFQTRLIHISTDFVFDGLAGAPYQETDPTGPQGVYAQTKLEGEQAIAQTFDDYFIVRTSWLYSQFGQNFMKTILRLANERSSLNVVSDQIGTPTNANDLADAILRMILSEKPAYGIYHYSNEGTASWFDFAREIFDLNGINIELGAIPTEAYPAPAKRPKYSVLDKTKIKTTFHLQIPDWKTSLKSIKKEA